MGRPKGALVTPEHDWLRHPELTEARECVLVHGELHLGNVLRRSDGNYAIVDYRNVGPGPRCIDFATAEVNTVLRLVPPAEDDEVSLVTQLRDVLVTQLWPFPGDAVVPETPSPEQPERQESAQPRSCTSW